jgi:hypothetical protein
MPHRPSDPPRRAVVALTPVSRGRTSIGYLTQDYDGIARLTWIRLTQAGSKTSVLARVSDNIEPVPTGTQVMLSVDRGRVTIISIGGT